MTIEAAQIIADAIGGVRTTISYVGLSIVIVIFAHMISGSKS